MGFDGYGQCSVTPAVKVLVVSKRSRSFSKLSLNCSRACRQKLPGPVIAPQLLTTYWPYSATLQAASNDGHGR